MIVLDAIPKALFVLSSFPSISLLYYIYLSRACRGKLNDDRFSIQTQETEERKRGAFSSTIPALAHAVAVDTGRPLVLPPHPDQCIVSNRYLRHLISCENSNAHIALSFQVHFLVVVLSLSW